MHAQESSVSCPSCGLTLAIRARWRPVRHCPRCLARTRSLVEMIPLKGDPDPIESDRASKTAKTGPAHTNTRSIFRPHL